MTTDQNGVAVLELDAGTYTVRVSHPAYVAASADTPALQPGQEVEMPFQLDSAKARVRVVVRDRKTGNPISGATVEATPKA